MRAWLAGMQTCDVGPLVGHSLAPQRPKAVQKNGRSLDVSHLGLQHELSRRPPRGFVRGANLARRCTQSALARLRHAPWVERATLFYELRRLVRVFGPLGRAD